MNDTRNVSDEFKGMEQADIVKALDGRGIALEIAIENNLRDYNMGTIVRTANAFGVRTVHIIGSRQWNKRGAMMTDKYLRVEYHSSISDFATQMHLQHKTIIAIDNVPGSVSLTSLALPLHAVMLFGAEGPGISDELLKEAAITAGIDQVGSTRSINVGVAAGIAMHWWVQTHA